MTWSGAKNECQQTGGYLVTVTSREEDQWVFSNVSRSEEIWMGATDEVTEGIWEWVTGEEFNYTNWEVGEPNDVGYGQDYLKPFSSGLWDDDGGPDIIDSIKKFACEWNS